MATDFIKHECTYFSVARNCYRHNIMDTFQIILGPVDIGTCLK